MRQSSYIALTYVVLLTIALSFAGVIARYRRSTSEVRQQIKWVAWMAMLGTPLLLVLYGGQELFGLPTLGEWNNLPWIAVVSVALPTAIGVASFRYRLYEIDRIISRTATYSILAAVLAIVYAGGVTLTQQILPVQNQFGIVISTLAVAALFNPLRQRIQRAIDRQFNRSRYDAQRVLEAFSSHCEMRSIWTTWNRRCCERPRKRCSPLTPRFGCASAIRSPCLQMWNRRRLPDQASVGNNARIPVQVASEGKVL